MGRFSLQDGLFFSTCAKTYAYFSHTHVESNETCGVRAATSHMLPHLLLDVPWNMKENRDYLKGNLWYLVVKMLVTSSLKTTHPENLKEAEQKEDQTSLKIICTTLCLSIDTTRIFRALLWKHEHVRLPTKCYWRRRRRMSWAEGE